MATARVCEVVDASPDRLWETLSDYRGWRLWLKEVADSEMEDGIVDGPSAIGIIRRVGDRDAPLAREQLLGCDRHTMTLSYTALGSLPWPARNYVATVRLIPLTEAPGTVIDWSSWFDTDAADEHDIRATLEGLYRSFIDALGAAAVHGVPAG
jgi:hypothetical protein